MSKPLFDPGRDPFVDIAVAMERARREQKNVLIHIGGDWCVWCQRLETFICEHPELAELREQRFVTIKVYLSATEDTNEAFFHQLPPFDGVPHLLIYNARGQMLCSQDTEVFEEDQSYNYERVKQFLSRWSNPRLTPYDALSTEELRRRFGRRLHAADDSGPILSA